MEAANYSSLPQAQHGKLVELAELGKAHLPVALTSAVLLLGAFLIQSMLSKGGPIANIPLVGPKTIKARLLQFAGRGSWDMYRESYFAHKETGFQLSVKKNTHRVALPYKMLPELNKIALGTLSSDHFALTYLHPQYYLKAIGSVHFKKVIMTALTPALTRNTAMMNEETIEAIDSELPQSTEWTDVVLHAKNLRMIAKACGRIFVGAEACKSEAYLHCATNFHFQIAYAISAIDKLPEFLRPTVAPHLPQIKKVLGTLGTAVEDLRQFVQSRVKEAKENSIDFQNQKPDDMLQWMIDSVDEIGPKQEREITTEQLFISFSAINSTTQFVSLACYMLASRPEIGDILRADVQEALDVTNGEMTNQTVQNMKRLDSFLKEVSRWYPLMAGAFQRKATDTIVLSNGLVIPKDAEVEIPWAGISRDPDIFPEPNTFDPLRFYKIRQEKANSAKPAETVAQTQFVSMNPQFLTWGYGKRACPGRFFANNVMKLFFAQFVTRYDVRMRPGHENDEHTLKENCLQGAVPDMVLQVRRR